jgi:serine/threonine protein kinase
MTLQPNSLFANRYNLIRKLGTGGFSEVWLAEDTKSGNIQVALKIFAANNGLDSEGLAEFSREFSMVFNLNHPHLLIPKHYEDWNDMPFLVLQYMAKGSTAKICGKIDENELSKFLVHIGSALQYLHQQEPPIVHLDIKPDNILIDNSGNYVLTDFGISTKIRRTLTKSMGNQTNSAGTTAYMAPERFSRKLNEREPVKANDLFSLGVTIFELLTDRLPYGDQGGIFAASNLEPADLPNTFSPELRSLVASCLAKEPWNRPTAEEILAIAKGYQNRGIWQLSERLKGGEPEYVETEKIYINRKTVLYYFFLLLIIISIILFIRRIEVSKKQREKEEIKKEILKEIDKKTTNKNKSNLRGPSNNKGSGPKRGGLRRPSR